MIWQHVLIFFLENSFQPFLVAFLQNNTISPFSFPLSTCVSTHLLPPCTRPLAQEAALFKAEAAAHKHEVQSLAARLDTLQLQVVAAQLSAEQQQEAAAAVEAQLHAASTAGEVCVCCLHGVMLCRHPP